MQRYGLSRSDEEVISVLATYLRRNTAAYLLLQSQGLFNQAATLALADRVVTPGSLSSLRVRLGFTGRVVGAQLHSSVDIPPGASVLLELRRSREVPATVLSASTDTLRVTLQPTSVTTSHNDEPRLTPGRTVRVVYQNEAGVFAFESAVLQRKGVELSLQHSEDIVSIQKRDHYRKKIRLPVSVSSALSDDDPVPSEFLDIGGGGASLYNPDKRFQPGDSIFLTFSVGAEGDSGREGQIAQEGRAGGDSQFAKEVQTGRLEHPRSLDLVATVLRTSLGGRVIHVRYGNIRESDRDRVYRLLFQPPPHGTDQESSRRSHPS
ncbi:MAG: PilZ domain-containing protein [Alkalispirochaeta sp.]